MTAWLRDMGSAVAGSLRLFRRHPARFFEVRTWRAFYWIVLRQRPKATIGRTGRPT